MPEILYQQKAEPLAPPSPPTPISQWQPVCPAFLLFRELSGTEVISPVLGDPSLFSLDWLPTWTQPNRAITYAHGTTTVGPVLPQSNAPPDVASFGWFGPQPSRAIVYAAGMAFVGPVETNAAVVASDLMAAVVAQLRATPAVVSALGEDTSSSSTTKIWADDDAMGQPTPPYLTYSEPRGNKQYNFTGSYMESGTFDLSIISTAKLLTRSIAATVINSLNDQQTNMLFMHGQYVYIREDINSAQTISDVGPGTPILYKRVVTMKYIVAGSIATGSI